MKLIKKISDGVKNKETYKLGLLQTKAYRILKQRTTKLLEPQGISSVEWALLGLLNDVSQGMRLKILADELGVEAPFVTTMTNKLQDMNLIDLVVDPDDSRAKRVCLTSSGKTFVQKTEATLRDGMRPLLKDLSLQEVLTYMHVLQTIIDNEKTV